MGIRLYIFIAVAVLSRPGKDGEGDREVRDALARNLDIWV